MHSADARQGDVHGLYHGRPRRRGLRPEYTDRQLLQRIIGYFRPHLSTMSLVAIMIVLNALMDAAFPVLIARRPRPAWRA